MKPRILTTMLAIAAVLLTMFMLPRPAASAERAREIMPYAWFTGIEGTITIEGRLQGIDAGTADVRDNTNAGGNVRCETWRGGNGFYLDLFYANLTGEFGSDDDRSVLAYNHELGSTPVFVDQRDRDNREIRYLSFGVLVGGRYFRLKNTLEESNGDNREQTGQFIDPIVGGYLHYRMARALTFVAAGDIGGFAIGSEFTWNAWTRFHVRLTDWLWINALARAFDIRYEEGSGDDRIGLNARIAGPAVGVIFRF